jgi:hypothetical protein
MRNPTIHLRSAHLFLPGPAHVRPAQAAPSPRARHCCHGPPISLSPPPLFGRQRADGARRPLPPISGRCRSARTLLLVPRFLSTSAWFPDPHRPPASPTPSQKGAGRRRRASAPFFPSSVLTPTTPWANPPSPSRPPNP